MGTTTSCGCHEAISLAWGAAVFAEQFLHEVEARQVAAFSRAPEPQETRAVIARRCKREEAVVRELRRGHQRRPAAAGRTGSRVAARAAPAAASWRQSSVALASRE